MSSASCWYLGSSGRGDWIVIETAKVLSLLGMVVTTTVAPSGAPPLGRGIVKCTVWAGSPHSVPFVKSVTVAPNAETNCRLPSSKIESDARSPG